MSFDDTSKFNHRVIVGDQPGAAIDPQAQRIVVHQAFTLVELLVVISVIAILASMLLPAISVVRNAAHSARCQSSLLQLGMGIQAYAGDNNGLLISCVARYPSTASETIWYSRIHEYIDADWVTNINMRGRGTVLWGCPTWQGRETVPGILNATKSGYGMNWRPAMDLNALGATVVGSDMENNYGISYWGGAAKWRLFRYYKVTLAGSRLLVVDAIDWMATHYNPLMFASRTSNTAGTQYLNGPRHRGNRVNILFFDGHIESRSATDAVTALNNPDSLP